MVFILASGFMNLPVIGVSVVLLSTSMLVGCEPTVVNTDYVNKESGLKMAQPFDSSQRLSDVTAYYSLPESMSSCKIYFMPSNGALPKITVVDCLDVKASTTNINYNAGKTNKQEAVTTISPKD